MWLQLLFVLLAIIVGARVGGIGLGVFGGLGLAVLTFVFGLEPTTPPIDVMLMIVAVIAAAGCMQAAGGLDLMVKWAEKILRRHPQRITLLSPLVTYLFTFFAGTGHVAYSVLPVIAEVARETGIRPERPMGIAVIASQQAITASPISAATVALLSMLAGYDITLFDILKISIPCTLVGVLAGAIYSMRVGKELKDDPVYQARLKSGELSGANYCTAEVANPGKALTSVLLFLGATVGIVLFGSIDSLRPSFQTSEGVVVMQMAHIIEVLMLSVAALILLLTGTSGMKAAKSSVFNAGMQAVVAIFRYCVDGRYLYLGQHCRHQGKYIRSGDRYAVAFRYCAFCHVHPAVQSGGNHPCLAPFGYGAGYFTLYADCPLSGSQRVFFHPELSDGGGSHQF